MLEKETLKSVLLKIVDNIDSGNSNYSEKEEAEIIDTINRITNTQNKLSKYQACKYIGKSRATFDNYVRAGKIPDGFRQAGFKEKFWTKESLESIKRELDNE